MSFVFVVIWRLFSECKLKKNVKVAIADLETLSATGSCILYFLILFSPSSELSVLRVSSQEEMEWLQLQLNFTINLYSLCCLHDYLHEDLCYYCPIFCQKHNFFHQHHLVTVFSECSQGSVLCFQLNKRYNGVGVIGGPVQRPADSTYYS